MRKWMGVAAALALLIATPASAADLATPTATAGLATPGPVATPDSSQRANDLSGATGGQRFQNIQSFDGGIQVGTEAAGAAKLTFVAHGVCNVDLPAIAAIATPVLLSAANKVKVNCTVPGVAVGDRVFGDFRQTFDTEPPGPYDALSVIRRYASAANTLTFVVRYDSYPAIDAPALPIDYLVVR